MKTEQIMLRDLHGVKIRQNHKTGFFSATDLLSLYNSKNPNQRKDLFIYMKTKNFKEYKKAVLQDIISNTTKNNNFKNGSILDNDLLIETKRGRKTGGTWFHPYLFIDFAMWLSPEFKLTCVKWIFDNLIKFRDECGDGFKKVNEALFNKKPNTPWFEYANEAKMINKLVFGDPKGGQRNEATEAQLSLLKGLQNADVKLINEGLDYYDRYKKLLEIKKYHNLLS